MNVLITGGTGFVGRLLAEELSRDHRVHLLVRDPRRLERLACRERVTALAGDLESGEALPADTELVFHLAALTKARRPADFQAVNVGAHGRFLERLRPLRRLRRVLLLSSLAAAGPSPCDRPLTEEDRPAPVSLYGRSKLDQETVLQAQSPVPWVIVRAPIVFGPGDLDMLQALRTVRHGWLLQLGRERRRFSIIHVDDLVAAVAAAAFTAADGELFYAANGEPIEWASWLGAAAQLLGNGRLRRLVVPVALGGAAAGLAEARGRLSGRPGIFNRDKFREMRHPCWLCSGEKMARVLGFRPRRPLADGLAQTVDWYRRQGLL